MAANTRRLNFHLIVAIICIVRLLLYQKELLSNVLSATLQESWADHIESPLTKQNQLAKWRKKLPCLKSWVKSTQRRYHSEVVSACSQEWAYIHVLKSGGTTVQAQCNDTKQKIDSHYHKTHRLFTFVRDPVSHFLSGYLECAERKEPPSFAFKAENETLQKWLTQNRAYMHWCFQHSIPQIEYLLFKTEPMRFLDHFHYIGDKEEMSSFFREKNLPWNESKVARRWSSTKTNMTAIRDVNRLNPDLVKQICDFVKIDYCFFDYIPPKVCQPMVTEFCEQTCGSI